MRQEGRFAERIEKIKRVMTRQLIIKGPESKSETM